MPISPERGGCEGDPEGDEPADDLPRQIQPGPEELPFAYEHEALIHVGREGREAAEQAGEQQCSDLGRDRQPLLRGSGNRAECETPDHIHDECACGKQRAERAEHRGRQQIAAHRSDRAANRYEQEIHVRLIASRIMPVLELLTSSGFGSLLGMRHALEPDHLAAVSTLVSRERNTVRAAWLGVCWGVGHTLGLIVVGAALVLFRSELPARVADLFELLVAIMLIVLGSRAVLQAVRQGEPAHVHQHAFAMHRHSGLPAHVHIGAWTLARRPLVIGAIHGLAGSGALTALVLTTLPSTASRLAYMALFGLGSTIGMAVLSGLLGWPLARLGSHRLVVRGISFAVGAMSMVLGLFWGYPLVDRIF
jgi:hypothetical protein